MSTPTSAGPPPSEAADLDTRILQAEQRLIAREQALWQGVEALGLRLRRAWQPWRRALPAAGLTLGVAAAGVLAWWGWRRGARGFDAASRHAGSAQPAGQGGGIPWVRLVALGWPLLPAAWRSRVSPASASALVALGLPMVEWLLRGHTLPPPATMPSVDLERFAGTWCVVAQLPRQTAGRGAAPGLMHYLPRENGDFDVVVDAPGARSSRGLAQVVPGSGGAKLVLSLWPAWLRWLPLAWNDHWILHLDPARGEALVGSARRYRLFVLSRQPRLAPQRRHALLLLARERGFAVEPLQPVDAD